MTDLPIWTDQSFLRDVQYRDDSNLAARQSIYACQRPMRRLPALVLDALGLRGSEQIADVGCGNGLYLAELASRDHHGTVLGIDMSPGMLTAARRQLGNLPAARVLGGDATALPLRTGSSDVTMASHMLYHVPEPADAVSELRRVTRSGGQVVVTLNGGDHLSELHELIRGALADTGLAPFYPPGERLRLDQGEDLLAGFFGSVARHDFTSELLLSDVRPVADYVRSMSVTLAGAGQDQLMSAITRQVVFAADGYFRVRTHSGTLICR